MPQNPVDKESLPLPVNISAHSLALMFHADTASCSVSHSRVDAPHSSHTALYLSLLNPDTLTIRPLPLQCGHDLSSNISSLLSVG